MNVCNLNIIILIIILRTGFAASATISINPGQSIQAAINAADQGDTIEVHSGTYYENVNVFKPLVLRGIGYPIINAANTGSGIILYSDNSVIEGFFIANSSASNPGINISNSSHANVIKNNTITRNRGDGVGIWASENNRGFRKT